MRVFGGRNERGTSKTDSNGFFGLIAEYCLSCIWAVYGLATSDNHPAAAVFHIYRYASESCIQVVCPSVQKWYAYQKTKVVYHFLRGSTSRCEIGLPPAARAQRHRAAGAVTA
eukprot:1310044-Prymnesium_polylepis.1